MTEVKTNNIVYQIVPLERIELVTRKNHQGVLAWLSVIEYQYIANLLPMIFEKGEDPLIIALDGYRMSGILVQLSVLQIAWSPCNNNT